MCGARVGSMHSILPADLPLQSWLLSLAETVQIIISCAEDRIVGSVGEALLKLQVRQTWSRLMAIQLLSSWNILVVFPLLQTTSKLLFLRACSCALGLVK